MKKKFAIIASLLPLLFAVQPDAKCQWVQTKGPSGESITALAVIGPNLFAGTGIFFGGSGTGVFISSDNGMSWASMSAGLRYGYYKGDVICLAVNGTDIFAGTDSGVFRSTDNGTSWTGWSTGLFQDSYITAITTIGTNLFAAAAGGGTTREIFLSTDNGLNWTATYNGLLGGSAWALAVSGTNLFAGTFNGVFLSPDNGTSWKEINNGLIDTLVLALAEKGADLFAGTVGGGVFLSTNNGTNWIPVNNGLPKNASVDAFCVTGNSIFAGTLNDGVFLSIDNGTNWHNVSIGLTDTAVFALAVSGTNLFAGTKHEVWRRSLSDFGISTVSQLLPSINSVISFPNPLRESTSIKFSSPDRAFTQVSIHNLLGSEVAHFFSGSLDGGEHFFTWDAHGMPPGMYICIIRASGRTEELPMMLVK